MTPRDYPPLTPGELLLEEFMKPLEMSIDSLAEHLGISRYMATQLIEGKRRISPRLAEALGGTFNMSAQFWENVQSQYDNEVEADLSLKRGFTTAQAANYIGISQSSIRQLLRENRIGARRQGSLLIWLREDLDNYLDTLPEA